MEIPIYKNMTFEESRRFDYLFLVDTIFPNDMTDEMKKEYEDLLKRKNDGRI
jgi:hypothetical protein